MDILDEITAHKRLEVAALKREVPLPILQGRVEPLLEGPKPVSMAAALLASPSGIIAEFKRKSPSKGWIKEEGEAAVIPLGYQRNGAAALSILADGKYFGGSPDFIAEARESGVTLPILYKEFVVDAYQLYLARLCDASAVLLIAAELSREECRCLIDQAHTLGLEVLLEMHSGPELEYAALGPDMCGINNRNLGTFVTDVENSFRLAEKLPQDAVKVSESGIGHPETLAALRQCGFRGFLIGERFMKETDPGAALGAFIAQL
ncbi:MAG: indole-3-glycerol phosphate synthase TrpC [Bacteroidales bacterium]|nr:indole-3-glycerol phosphate synthase TrpC [Bacteroidales bacterium]